MLHGEVKEVRKYNVPASCKRERMSLRRSIGACYTKIPLITTKQDYRSRIMDDLKLNVQNSFDLMHPPITASLADQFTQDALP